MRIRRHPEIRINIVRRQGLFVEASISSALSCGVTEALVCCESCLEIVI